MIMQITRAGSPFSNAHRQHRLRKGHIMPRKRKNYKKSNICHTPADIVNAYNRRSNDILQNTPGGSVAYKDTGKAVTFFFGRASINMIDYVKDKKFVLDEEMVNSKVRLILKESESGRAFSQDSNDLDWRFQSRTAEGKSLVLKRFPKTPEHPRSPKFQAYFVEGHAPGQGEKLWIVIIPAKRKLV